ncbi:MAG: hypothetical protein HFI36_05735 [Bacilli bacterium]|jgi:hypothetical protein|nr:hypothetical protein [Bacilli bacterium]MCX4254576.1 hypothetical protein [Bacilli bacterium]
MRKLNQFGYSKIEILVIVLLLGVVAFITINQTSYAFAIDNSSAVEETKGLIELQAENYAIDNLDLFKETTTTYISVNDLVENKYLIGNDEGLITNPSDSSKNYNDNKIKLEYNAEKNKVVASFID